MRLEFMSINAYKEFIREKGIKYQFLQMPSYAKVNDRFILAGLNEQGNPTHAVIIELRPAMKLWKFAYTAGWYLSTDKEHDAEFINSVSDFLKLKGYILWRMESATETEEYDKDGNKVEGGYSNRAEIEELVKKTGFIWHDLGKGINTNYQNTWQSVVNLKKDDGSPRPIEEIDSEMAGSARKYMRKAKREGFVFTTKKPSEMTKKDWHTLEEMLSKSAEHGEFDKGSADSRKALATASEDCCLLGFVHNAEGEPVYAGYWYYTNYEMMCYFAGLDRSKLKYNLSSFVHHTMYERAIEMGLERYNFGGISGYFNKGEEGYGCYLMKRELGCRVIRTFGVFDKPLTNMGNLFEKKVAKTF